MANETTATAGLWNGQDWRLGVRFMKATGWKFIVTSCDEQATTSLGTVLRCPFESTRSATAEVGRGPAGDPIDLTISDGKIVATRLALQALNGFVSQMEDPFNAWVRANYPYQTELLYADATMMRYRITEESLPVWGGPRAREYVEEVLAGTTPTT